MSGSDFTQGPLPCNALSELFKSRDAHSDGTSSRSERIMSIRDEAIIAQFRTKFNKGEVRLRRPPFISMRECRGPQAALW